MKLPDFYIFEPLNVVKKKMGVARDVHGDLQVKVEAGRLTELELEKLTSTRGLDVFLGEVTVPDDGTLAYKDSRVLLYIRDVTAYGTRDMQPRYHVANCSTLRQMRQNDRFDRYVIAARSDGHFELNIVDGNRKRSMVLALAVCQNCLDHLHFGGFHMRLPKRERINHVKAFSLGEFFVKYPRSLHESRPKYRSDNAPDNTYSADFDDISRRVRTSVGWRCSQCGIDLSAPEHRKWLHVHHKNALRHDNCVQNLKVVCFGCHAEQTGHTHNCLSG